MANVTHSNLTGAIAIHPAAYIQSSDPGAVGAGKLWIDTSTGAGTVVSPYPIKKRNSGNSAWEYVGGAAGGTLASLTGDVTITSVTGGHALIYDTATSKWVNRRSPSVSIYAARSFI